jgi:3-dehydroquinate dehydratase/shikimate dehydrogenase
MFPGPVCLSLTPRRAADVSRAVTVGADCIEVRLDYLNDPGESVDVRWRDLPAPAIATCRGREQGGRFRGSVEAEVRILQRAVEDGARYVDVDYRIARAFGTAEVIGSYHDFARTPEDLGEILDAICRTSVSVAKVATMVESWSDNRRLFDLLERPWPKPVIVIGMGPMGQITRVALPFRGSALTYVAQEERSAPGQLGLSELIETYRFRQLGARTRMIGIVGNPVEHSRSPELHNRAFRAAGLDYVYLKFPVLELSDFFETATHVGIEGFSITIPHKIAAMEYLDEVTPDAQAVGAVNTVYRDGDKWKGDNTDVHGIREALKDFDARGKNVVILGTGGAARAAVVALESAGSITLLSHTRDAGMLDWPSRRVKVDRLQNYRQYDADLLVNATPVGMMPDVEATPVTNFLRAKVVFDMVYNPTRTRLLREASSQGIQVVSGTAMFVAQAARQFEIWTGRPVPRGVYSEGVL